jgi:DNA modification methylase
MPDNSADCCVTSPPYFALRDYGVDGQIGLEETPEKYIASLVEVFTEVHRVMKPTGTLWLNIGDSYAGSGKGIGDDYTGRWKQGTNKGIRSITQRNRAVSDSLKPKDLIGIPWMLAFALRSAGWYLRQDIIWNKPNPMPESVTDRCTKAHEYIFLLTKSPRYYYDAVAIKTQLKDSSIDRLWQNIEAQQGSARVPGKTNGNMKAVKFGGNKAEGYGTRIHSGKEWNPQQGGGGTGFKNHSGNYDASGNLIGGGMANKKSVWTVPTYPFKAAHFATFPEQLIVDCIKAGSSEHGCCDACGAPYERVTEKTYKHHQNWYGNKQSVRNSRGKAGNSYNELINSETTGWAPTCTCNAGITPALVLDPFSGAATTALVARKLGRDYVAIELNPEYINLSHQRLRDELGMFV